MTEGTTTAQVAALGPTLERVTFQSALREIRQLCEERLQERVEFEAQLQQRNEMFRRMEERMCQMDANIKLSYSNNRSSFRAGNLEEIGARESINKELGYKLKDIFDGTIPLREFFSQFELIVRANQWNDATKMWH